jgi:hypothetical protein
LLLAEAHVRFPVASYGADMIDEFKQIHNLQCAPGLPLRASNCDILHPVEEKGARARARSLRCLSVSVPPSVRLCIRSSQCRLQPLSLLAAIEFPIHNPFISRLRLTCIEITCYRQAHSHSFFTTPSSSSYPLDRNPRPSNFTHHSISRGLPSLDPTHNTATHWTIAALEWNIQPSLVASLNGDTIHIPCLMVSRHLSAKRSTDGSEAQQKP